MIVLSSYLKNNTTWAKYDGVKSETFTPDEMPLNLIDAIKNSKNGNRIYISNLHIFMEDVIQTLFLGGYKFLKENINLKKMKNYDCKYLINGDNNPYQFILKYKKNIVYIVNADNLISMTDYDKITGTWDNNEEPGAAKLAHATYDCINEIMTTIRAKRRFPITISGVARRYWSNTLGFGVVKDYLVNASNTTVYGNMTLEKYCREAYHGGLCLDVYKLRHPRAEIQKYSAGIVLDNNSIYPYVMRVLPLPYGKPFYGKGKPSDKLIELCNKKRTYMYLRVKVAFRLKPDGIPCIQLGKNSPERFVHERSWLTDSRYFNWHTNEFVPVGENAEYPMVELTLTQTDYKLMLENYDIFKIEYIDHMYQYARVFLFNEMIDTLYPQKATAPTPGKRRVVKMLLNSMSGNMAKLPLYENTIINIDNSGRIQYEYVDKAGSNSWVYIGAAITSYARAILINAGKRCGDRWLYCDTDSLHLSGTELPDGLEISGRLGAWKIEKQFDEAVYYRQKVYGLYKDGEFNLTMAGIPAPTIKWLQDIMANKRSPFDDANDLDVINPYVVKLTDSDKALIDAVFDDELDNDAYNQLRSVHDKLTEREREMQTVIDAINSDDVLTRIYFSRIPVTYVTHSDLFTLNLSMQWHTMSDDKFLAFA